MHMPSIRAAQKWGKRPTATIMGDDWHGHRHPLTGEPLGDRDEYTRWDYALMNAFQTIEDYTDDVGLLAWERDDEAANISADRKTHPFHAARDAKTRGKKGKPYEPSPGEYFVPKITSRRKDENGDDLFQSYREWVEKSIEKGE